MADDKFKLPASSYDELVRIIKAYGHTSGPASPADVAGFIGIHETVVSANNGFLLAAGIVEGGNRKSTTEVGQALAGALDHSIEDQIETHWRAVVEQTEFLQRLVTAVRIRNGMEPASLQAHVAYTAGQPNKGKVKTGSATVVEMLRTSGLLAERDGKLYAQSPDGGRDAIPADEAPVAGVRVEPERTSARPPGAADHATAPGVSVQIRVSVSCGVDELPSLTQHLKQMLRELPPGVEFTADADAE